MKDFLKITILILLFFFNLAGCSEDSSDNDSSDKAAPTVISVLPQDSSTDVDVRTNIVITFSEAMNESSLGITTTATTTSPFVFKNNLGLTIEVIAIVDSDKKIVTLDPSGDLSNETEYTVTISTDVKDSNDNALASDYSWSFTTEKAKPGIIVTEKTTSFSENGGTGSFTMVLNAEPNGDVRVDVSSDATSDVTLSSDSGNTTANSLSLTFTPLNWNTAQTVTLIGQDNNTETGHQSICISNSINTDYTFDSTGYISLSVNNVTITLTDDENTVPSVSVQNIHDKGLVETGFMIGSASDNNSVNKVEVKLDNGLWETATGTTDWTYKFPTDSDTWKDNTLHIIYTRSVDAANNMSNEVSITVRKGRNKDINGDGYADLAVGAKEYDIGTNTNEGEVYLFYSSGVNGISSVSAAGASATITGEEGSNFGGSVVIGDINSDGYADLAVGAVGTTNSVHIFHSQGANGISVSAASDANTIIEGETDYTQLGKSIDIGDINGDGFGDLAVGSYSSHSGRVYIFHSLGSNGIVVSNATNANMYVQAPGPVHMGTDVAIGDINGDGYADLAVAAENGNNQYNSHFYVFHSTGATGILSNTPDLDILLSKISWGITIDLGDINGDGYNDLILGEYGKYAHTVSIFHNSGTGGIMATTLDQANIRIGGATSGSVGFGNSVVGDINGDGYSDLVAGFSSLSRAYIYYSTGAEGISSTTYTEANTTINGTIIGSSFGNSIAFADFNGDGFVDLSIGANNFDNGTDTNEGRTYVFHSPGSAGISASTVTEANTVVTGKTNSFLGNYISR